MTKPEYWESKVGETYYELTFTKYLGKLNGKNHFYEATCSCGVQVPAFNWSQVQQGVKKACGHLKGSNNPPKYPNPKQGDRFNEWTVVTEGERRNGNRAYICRCSCGSTGTLTKQQLVNGKSKACKNHKFRTNHGDITGRRYGTLTVVRVYQKRTKGKYYKHAECICDCGRTTHPQVVSLTSGGTVNCSLPLCSANGTPSYAAVHHHMSRTRGPAYKQPCTDCGERAHHWSYTHGSPDEHLSEWGSPYSLDIYAYEPRCRTCHYHYDKAHGQINVNYSR